MRCVPITPVSPRKPAAKPPPRGSLRSIASPPYPSARPRGKQRPIHSPHRQRRKLWRPAQQLNTRISLLTTVRCLLEYPEVTVHERGPRMTTIIFRHSRSRTAMRPVRVPPFHPHRLSLSPIPNQPPRSQPSTMFHNVPPPPKCAKRTQTLTPPPGHPWPPAAPSKRNPPKRPKPRQPPHHSKCAKQTQLRTQDSALRTSLSQFCHPRYSPDLTPPTPSDSIFTLNNPYREL
jgi:hypothetical protein